MARGRETYLNRYRERWRTDRVGVVNEFLGQSQKRVGGLHGKMEAAGSQSDVLGGMHQRIMRRVGQETSPVHKANEDILKSVYSLIEANPEASALVGAAFASGGAMGGVGMITQLFGKDAGDAAAAMHGVDPKAATGSIGSAAAAGATVGLIRGGPAGAAMGALKATLGSTFTKVAAPAIGIVRQWKATQVPDTEELAAERLAASRDVLDDAVAGIEELQRMIGDASDRVAHSTGPMQEAAQKELEALQAQLPLAQARLELKQDELDRATRGCAWSRNRAGAEGLAQPARIRSRDG